MAISFIPKEPKEEERKRKGFIPFWILYIIIPVLILAPILYFITRPFPEDIIVPTGLSMENLQELESQMEVLEKPLFQSLTSVIPEEFPVPKEKVGRGNPFSPVK
jgi:hypothetical protein